MAASEYTRGSMDISDQASTWNGFIKGSVWGSALILTLVAYLTFTLAIGMNWMIALVICAGAALVGGLLMGMGGAWIGTVVGLTALAVFVQIIIGISKALIG
ncbi:MAG: aa3-type cytochrome c oxidase subunit IV [Hyphomonadaceae bacterium]|nr:aa3-type cytochrome c oxidase subunit IV [Hyphomonadaceae bacterium]